MEQFLPKLDICLGIIEPNNDRFTTSVFRALHHAAEETQDISKNLSLNELDTLLEKGPKGIFRYSSSKPEAVFLRYFSDNIDMYVRKKEDEIFSAIHAVTKNILKNSLKGEHWISDEEASRIQNGGRKIEFRPLSLSLEKITDVLGKVFNKIRL